MGYFELIVGPMSSGKSTRLILELLRYKVIGHDTILLRPNIDKRYDKDNIVAHNGLKMKALAIPPIPERILANAQFFDVIGIDELQFFGSADYSLHEAIDELLKRNKLVVAAGLDTDFRREVFSHVHNLMPHADKLTKLTALCAICGDEAIYTQRLIDGEPAPYNSPIIEIGGLDHYEARCRECHDNGIN